MKVRDIMTSQVISAREATPLREVAQLLSRHHISGLPVCDDAGHIVGVISEYDLIANPDARSAGEAMTRDVIGVMEDTSVDEVRFLLVRRKIKRVPVLRGQRLVGIVSRADLVHELALTWVCQVCGEHERGTLAPETCPKCGVPSGYEPTASPPVGEGADVGQGADPRGRIDVDTDTCPTCGQSFPEGAGHRSGVQRDVRQDVQLRQPRGRLRRPDAVLARDPPQGDEVSAGSGGDTGPR